MKKVIKKLFGKRKFSFSLKESLDLCNLPVITFTMNNIKLNFLVDSGSTNSLIDKSLQKELNISEFSGDVQGVYGVGGNTETSAGYKVKVSYMEHAFEGIMFPVDLQTVFKKFKENTGVQLHGILGTDFLQRYKTVLDFDKLKVNIKK